MENFKLTTNFSFFELTRTNRTEFQDENRILTNGQHDTLLDLARLLEEVRLILEVPIIVPSGYRCPGLNEAVGSSAISQHLKCEAADIVPKGLDIGDAFRTLWKSIADGKLNVGQLIFENANRGYREASWIHVSLGFPFRGKERCNQILRMTDGKYELLSKLPWKDRGQGVGYGII